jgi:hypothetical protein
VGFGYVLVQLLPLAYASYGYFQDEFYYLSCAMRPAFGYVDHPPFAPWVLAVTRTLLGDSLLAIRWLPALSGGAVVVLSGLLARRLGAGLWGQLVAALCVLSTPMILGAGSFFSVNCFATLFWTLACYLLIRLIQTRDTRWWLPLGLLSGIALLNKHTYAFLLIVLFVGMVATPLRRHLMERRLWLGVGVTALCLLPNLLWQSMHGWPAAEVYQSIAQHEANFGPLRLVGLQIAGTGATCLIWVPGLLFFLRSAGGRAYRIFGIMYLVALAILMLLESSRPDRIMGFYPVLFAAGATLLEEHARRSRPIRLAFTVSVIAVVSVGVAALPLVLPVLSPARLVAYPLLRLESSITKGDPKGEGPIPLGLAYRRGWDRLLAQMARVYQGLGAEGSGPRASGRAGDPRAGLRTAGSLQPPPDLRALGRRRGHRLGADRDRGGFCTEQPRGILRESRARRRPRLSLLHRLAQRRSDLRGARAPTRASRDRGATQKLRRDPFARQDGGLGGRKSCPYARLANAALIQVRSHGPLSSHTSKSLKSLG